jgi:hypothetical protein
LKLFKCTYCTVRVSYYNHMRLDCMIMCHLSFVTMLLENNLFAPDLEIVTINQWFHMSGWYHIIISTSRLYSVSFLIYHVH